MDDDLIALGLIDDDEIVLDEAALALALLDHSDVDDEPYHAVLRNISDRLSAIAPETSDAQEQADLLAQVLGREFGFVGDSETYDDPANADLIRVIERRRGLPVSLSILYVGAARQLGWTANVLDLPGHVLVLVGDEADPVIIDPFRRGQAVEPDQLAAMVHAMHPERVAVSHVAAMPNRAILVRLLLNQASRAEGEGRGRRALTLYQRMTVMAPSHGLAWWERARLEMVDGDFGAARSSLAAMLETTREPALRQRISDVLASLPRGQE